MSHVVIIETEVRDAAAVEAACQRLGLPQPTQGTTRLFSGEATGLAVQLPGWHYPVVCELATGQLKYDNFSGRWGRGGSASPLPPGLRDRTSQVGSPPPRSPGYRDPAGGRLREGHGSPRRSRMKTIEIIVSPSGQVRIETKGFSGSECQEASRFIEQALGKREGLEDAPARVPKPPGDLVVLIVTDRTSRGVGRIIGRRLFDGAVGSGR